MTTPFKVTIIDHEWEDTNIEEEIVASYTTSEQPIELSILQSQDKSKIVNAAKNSDAIIIMYANIDREILKKAPNLKLVSRYGIGINMVDVDAATEANTIVANVNDYCVDEVSDHALASILSAARRLVPYNDMTRKGQWDFKQVAIPLRSSKATVGLLGYGKIPRRLAEKLNVIGYQVYAYDPFVDGDTMKKDKVVKATVEEIMRNCDFVSVHVPLIDDTYHLVGVDELNMMKRNAYIINTARGPIIDEIALIEALKENKIAGAFLDVTEKEPLPSNHVLRTMDQVVLTPHAAWYSEDAFREIRQKAIMNVIEVAQGKLPTYHINKNVLVK
ncbi:C-terminal binding protein [Oceanobacillus damuensis]|uniref:C-terminal binding protein n=1 Tax=Oceanobacillus damuensis TaxID=937928 RepID=UPI00082F869D|nr:C-terminal binding protein [Oceanobacillus damuensis]